MWLCAFFYFSYSSFHIYKSIFPVELVAHVWCVCVCICMAKTVFLKYVPMWFSKIGRSISSSTILGFSITILIFLVHSLSASSFGLSNIFFALSQLSQSNNGYLLHGSMLQIITFLDGKLEKCKRNGPRKYIRCVVVVVVIVDGREREKGKKTIEIFAS